jgi:hypothetical protein
MLPTGAPPDAAVERAARTCYSEAATIAVALAATALPFAGSHPEEAERWLRILRVHGMVGNAMQALGVPEQPLYEYVGERAIESRDPDALAAVINAASHNAREYGSGAIATEDLLVGVLSTYGAAFDHALEIRGTTKSELLERVARGRSS